jgi:signal transduction histidine kinase/HPt (histidine-containing phosphotransfer) domain-containing protein/FixJ family two-component response regulator/HAMP domain-containing protein
VSGRRTASIRGLLKGLLGVVVVLAALLSIVTLLQVRTATKRSEAERQRVTSFRLSDGMRQSSNDLTRMVRLYVTTGDPRYRRYYDEILAIRSGDAPRPLDYDSSFWDRVLADGEGQVRRGPPAALTELMRRAHFSTDEFAALAASLRASNDLALLELKMMNMVAPRIAAGVDRDYLREVAPRYARLVDDNYHAQKRKIMEAIDRFTALVDARTARRAQDLQGSTDRLLAVQTAILVLLAAVLAAALVVAARSIVRPLSRLADVTRRITLGDWSQRAEPHGVAELTQLAGDFNEMADAIENDLAGRRIAEREAREAENRLQTIADRVPGAVFQFHIDVDGGFNVRFTSRHGSIHRPARNQDGDFPGMSRVVLPEDRGGWLDTMLTAARSGRPWAHEYRIHTPEGGVAWMQGQALTVKNADGSAELYGFVADVTERKALEADLRRAREDAEAADRAKSAFLAMMSHELRTPLVAVTGTLEILALDALDERQRELVDVAMGSARALLAVIGDVLDFSKIEAGFLDLAPVTVAVGPLVEEVAGQHRHAARLRGLELTTTLDPALGAAHVVDAGRLRQVLGNLLGNAMKFTREGGVAVDVTVLDGGGGDPTQRVALAVSDTGMGIATEDQRRLFVPFTQASTDHARSSEGTGLGLAICRQLVEAMGGTVTLRSAPGQGTTVTVELPLVVGASADAEPTAGSDGAAVAAGRRMLPASREAAEQDGSLVLLVEDHPVNRQVLAAQLEAIGFRVDTAGDAAEALERFAGGRYGLVFTDIQLPHVDGYELARRLRDAERASGLGRTPLLALTASALQGERERCRAVGMDDVVTKPTTMAVLAGTLRRWLPHVAWPEPGNATPAAPSTRRALPPAVDGSALDELVAGDAELGARILASYAASIQDEVVRLAEALEDGDREALRRLAHQVAGASRAVGAGQAADAAEHLEQAAGAGEGHEELADRLRDLRDALVAVMPVGG